MKQSSSEPRVVVLRGHRQFRVRVSEVRRGDVICDRRGKRLRDPQGRLEAAA